MSSPQLDATPSVFGPGQAHGSSRELIKSRGGTGVAKTGHAWKSFAAGSAAAMVSGAVTHPIDLVKVRLQLATSGSAASPSMMGTAAAVIRHEGAAALYKGLSASLLRQATFIGTKFGSYDVLKSTCQSMNGGEPCMSFASKVVCGFGAGALGAAVGNPADLAMVRMQADGRLPVELRRNYTGVGNALYRITTEEGVGTLWRGCTPTVQRAMIITASQLAVYDQIKEELVSSGVMQEGPSVYIAASFFASGVASLTSNPVDVLKTRLMSMRPDAAGSMPYKGLADCCVKMVSEEGLLALWKGTGPTLARQAPLNAVRFVCVEQFKRLFDLLSQPPQLSQSAHAER